MNMTRTLTPDQRERKLGQSLTQVLLALNQRGELNPGGHDFNTEIGVAYRAAVEALHELGIWKR